MEIKGLRQSWQPAAKETTNILKMSKCTYTALTRSESNLRHVSVSRPKGKTKHLMAFNKMAGAYLEYRLVGTRVC